MYVVHMIIIILLFRLSSVTCIKFKFIINLTLCVITTRNTDEAPFLTAKKKLQGVECSFCFPAREK